MAAPDIFAGTCPSCSREPIVFFSRKTADSLDQLIELDLSPRQIKREFFFIVFHIVILFSCELQVLLVTSSRRPDSWIVPGGGVEPEEEPSVTALREVREEAGVLGQLGRCLGTFEVITHDVCHANRCSVMLYQWELSSKKHKII